MGIDEMLAWVQPAKAAEVISSVVLKFMKCSSVDCYCGDGDCKW